MGRTPTPLTILVAPEWLTHEKIAELAAKGHTIAEAPTADLILSPNAHWWHDTMWKFLPAALKRARARKKEEKHNATE